MVKFGGIFQKGTPRNVTMPSFIMFAQANGMIPLSNARLVTLAKCFVIR